MKWIFVGLGNPGNEYDETRHNAGRMSLALFCKKNKLEIKDDKKNNAFTSKNDEAVFIMPNTFMNNSGKALISSVKSLNAAHHTIVVYDDMDLPLGKIKMSFNRSSGGHNGIKSIERAIKTQEFWRIRIGVSNSTKNGVTKKPSGEEAVMKFILGTFAPSQKEEFKKVLKTVGEIMEMIIIEGPERAMNVFN